MKKIFISYVKEDKLIATMLFNDLKSFGYNPWLDEIDLTPGANWKRQIEQEIKNCSNFITLLSNASISKKGYFHKELKAALEKHSEMPSCDIFIIPVCLDKECFANFEPLGNYQQIDLSSSYINGIQKIREALDNQRSGSSLKISNKQNKTITIYELKQEFKGEKLKMTWSTFGEGISILERTINELGSIHPDIYIGVNTAGTIIAAYLSYRLNSSLGYIKTGPEIKIEEIDENGQLNEKKIREVDDTYLPKPKRKYPQIAVVDSEIKSGRSTKKIFDILKDEYKNFEMLSIVMGGVLDDCYLQDSIISNVYDFGWGLNRDEDKKYKPDILAYYINEPGFEPPGDIR